MDCVFKTNHRSNTKVSESQIQLTHEVIKAGHFFRSSDQRLIQRYKCLTCKRSFSTETKRPCKYQKKRQFNQPVFELLCSGVSLRRSAHLLRLNRKTIVRKFLFLGIYCTDLIEKQRHLFGSHEVQSMVFDDMESFEHTKCKPIAITLAVEEETRLILGFKVASQPAKGLLVKKALKKYGRRKDERSVKRKELFTLLKDVLHPKASIKSDMSTHYTFDVRKYFPQCQHTTFKGRKACVVGQGELKAIGFDPLFSLNHTAAMLRANINRLFRRSWNTTKKLENLGYHIALYTLYHNYKIKFSG